LWILDYDQEMGIAATFDAPEPRVWVSLADFETGVYVFFASDLDAVVVRELPDVEVEREPTGELAMLRFEPSRLRSGGCGALDVPVLLSSTCEAQGLSFAVTHDAALMRPLGARSAGIAMELRDGAGPEFLSVSLEADVDDCPLVSGGMAVSMVTAFEGIGGAALPPATSEPVLVLEYEILSAAAVGSRVQLRPRDCLRASATSEPAHLVLTCGGRTVVLATAPAVVEIVEACFTRGDCNADGSFDIVDPISLLLFLFHDIGGSGPIDCADACDTNDDGAADISDAIASLVRLFQGGPAPPNPYRDCGLDATSDDLFCRAHACSSGAPR
ncbi:MAG TPA: hypothetical protein VK116_05395, partial [Planctomycetota bacterium]|nr:hypothetical protein [Planctomycetota bacterium]